MVGVPRSAMTVRFGFPISQVLLTDDQGPIDPADPNRLRRFFPTPRDRFVFTVGGLVVQTLAVTAATIALAPVVGRDRFAGRIVAASLLMLLGYVVIDAVLTWRTGRPQGDSSLLWRLSPTATIACLLAVLAVHAGLLFALG